MSFRSLGLPMLSRRWNHDKQMQYNNSTIASTTAFLIIQQQDACLKYIYLLCPFHCVSNQTFLYCDPNDPNDIDLAVFHRIWPFSHQILPFPSRFKKIPSEFAVSHQIWPFSIKCGRFPMRFCRFSSNLSISHQMAISHQIWQRPPSNFAIFHQIWQFSPRTYGPNWDRMGQTTIVHAKLGLCGSNPNWDRTSGRSRRPSC